MQTYLAEKYMSGPKADAILARTGGKKKKRKQVDSSTGTAVAGPSFIKDDDVSGFAQLNGDDDDDTAAPVVASDRGFKKRRVAPVAGSSTEEGGGWATVREGVKEKTPPPTEDEQPLVVSAPAPAFKGGLLTKAQVAQAIPSVKTSSHEMTKEEAAAAQETIYRDASGRKIDMKAEKAEAARKKREREAKEAEKLQWGKGLVQRDEAEQTRKKLEKMKTTSFARTVDDKQINEEQKAVDRWNDPAAQFLTVCCSSLIPFRVIALMNHIEKENQGTPKTRIHWPHSSTQ
jgi:pre-mRNA-splicing factor CWC26